MKGGRKLSQWNLFVKKVYQEGKAKDSKYEFKQALEDASKRKSEMGSMKNASTKGVNKSKKAYRKSKGKRSLALAGGKTRKHRKH
jgi:hypothetical protein